MASHKGNTLAATWWHAERPIQRGSASHSPGTEALAALSDRSDTELAQELRVARTTASRWRREAGVKKQSGRPRCYSLLINDTTRAILRRFVEQRLSHVEVAALTGLTEPLIRQLYRRSGVRSYKGWRGLRDGRGQYDGRGEAGGVGDGHVRVVGREGTQEPIYQSRV